MSYQTISTQSVSVSYLGDIVLLFPPILSLIVIGPYREEADNRQRERNRIPSRIKYKHAACPGNGIVFHHLYSLFIHISQWQNENVRMYTFTCEHL